MAFGQRLMNWLVNEMMVNALANSKWFQRFAVRTDAALREAKEKGVKDAAKGVFGEFGTGLDSNSQAALFFKTMREELAKGIKNPPKQP